MAQAEGPKTRFASLDAMRGVAALAVVAFHFASHRSVPSERPFGYLAVDFFFMLSGFVLSFSYVARFEKGLRFGVFIRLRIRRLYPLYFLGFLLAMAVLGLRCSSGDLGRGDLIAAALSGVFMLPASVPDASPYLFPTIAPAWSLFFEFYVANVAFAVLPRAVGPWATAVIVSVSALLLLVARARYGTLDVGPMWTNALGGIPRVLFCFFAGCLLHTLHKAVPPPVNVPSLAVVIPFALVLLCPDIVPRGPFEFVCLGLLFPLLIYFGAGAVERRPDLGVALGDMSYAVYVIHYPLLKLYEWDDLPFRHRHEALFVAAMALAGFVLNRVFDRPVRSALARGAA